MSTSGSAVNLSGTHLKRCDGIAPFWLMKISVISADTMD